MLLNELKKIFELDGSPFSDTVDRLGINLRGIGVGVGVDDEDEEVIKGNVDTKLTDLIRRGILSITPSQISGSTLDQLGSDEEGKKMVSSGLALVQQNITKIEKIFAHSIQQSSELVKVIESGKFKSVQDMISKIKKDTNAVSALKPGVKILLTKQEAVLLKALMNNSAVSSFVQSSIKALQGAIDSNPADPKNISDTLKEIQIFLGMITILRSNVTGIQLNLS
jgi:hypothetical protein